MPVDVVLVIHPVAFRNMTKGRDGEVGQYIAKVTRAVRIATEVEAPRPGGVPRNRTHINYATGTLLKSIGEQINADQVSDVEGIVYVGAEHAAYVIHGTQPHLIRPKRHGGMLRFFWIRKGKWAVLPYVNHPGTIANDFMSRGLKKGAAVYGLH